MDTFTSYEIEAKEKLGDAATYNMFHNEEDPNNPDWVMNMRNMAAFQAVTLRPRVLVDVTKRSLSTEVFGQTIAFPVITAPVGWMNRFHPDGEIAVARAAASVGTAASVG